MAANLTGCSKLEQWFIIKCFVGEECKPCEIYERTCDVYEESYFS